MFGMNSYNPYGYATPQNQYMPQSMQQMNVQGQMSGQDLVTVQTIDQVEQVGLQPGQRKVVMVQNDPVVALRAADQLSGLVATKYYRLLEFDPRATVASEQTSNYITREELEERLNDFANSLKPSGKTKKEAAE